MTAPFILVPRKLTDAMMVSSSLAEPGPGEVLWNAATNYVVGQRVILLATHRVYECLIAGINATSPDLALTGATPRWFDFGPTNKWAAFDDSISTASTAVSSLSWVLKPGIFTAIICHGLQGGTVSFSVKDMPGGTVVQTLTQDLFLPSIDFWDYRFGGVRQLTKSILADVVPYADPEVTITITADGGGTVNAGMIAIGDLRPLVTSPDVGGTQFGASAKPFSNSYVARDNYGRFVIKRRASATDLRFSVFLAIEDADSALATLQEVLDVPVAIVASDLPLFTGLNAFGLVSGDLSYPSAVHANLSIDVKGSI